jgi:hypothetical protein
LLTPVLDFLTTSCGQVGTFDIQPGPSTAGSGGVPSARGGKYVLVLRRTGMQWKIDPDLWNLDRPAS